MGEAETERTCLQDKEQKQKWANHDCFSQPYNPECCNDCIKELISGGQTKEDSAK